ncbi:MAG: right-handed parallel beta-helix repeat-containing protein [Actinomycetota bacterium]
MVSRRLIASAALAAAVAAAPAAADPGAGQVEVLNDAGARVGDLVTGADALEAAVARIRAGALARTDDTRRWTIVAGAGTYGDAVVNEPNLLIRPSAGAAVTISGAGGANNTGGECIDVRRGGVTIEGLRCLAPADRGFEVAPPAAEGAIVLSGVHVDRARTDGIAVTGGADLLIRNAVVTSAGVDGVRLARLTGPGPYRVEGGTISRSGDDGVDLVDDAQRVQIAGVTIDASRGNGVESDDAGSTDLLVDGGTVRRGSGIVLGGGGIRHAVQGTAVTGSTGYGVVVGRATGTALRGLRLDGSNRSGDLRLTADVRTGTTVENVAFGSATLTLPGDPVGVIVSTPTAAQRNALTGLPPGYLSVGRFVRVRDTGGGVASAVTLRFHVPPVELAPLRLAGVQVFEDDPSGNRRQWQAVPGTRVDGAGGTVEVSLADGQIASGSDARFATYGPLGPPNGAPEILGVLPLPGVLVRGRDVAVRARVRDDEALGTGSFLLEVDGRRRGGVSLRGDLVQFLVGRLRPGIHTVRLAVVDANLLRAERTWSFAVTNGRPHILVRRAIPRPGALVLARRVITIAVPLVDDLPLATARTSLRVDGRQVPARVRAGRLVARVALPPGRHTALAAVRDHDGALAVRRWSFRVVRP